MTCSSPARAIIHILLPFLAPLMPLSVGYALIRHNILETAAVLTRRMFVRAGR